MLHRLLRVGALHLLSVQLYLLLGQEILESNVKSSTIAVIYIFMFLVIAGLPCL